jgi:7-carboxy-7-deazaguanine synthase
VRLRINEIFYSVQGESSHAGRPCIFVRLTGCPLRCRYCDTTYAFHEGRDLEAGAILAAIAAYPCKLVEVTGGEPLAQSGTPEFLRMLLDAGYEVLLETSGALDIGVVPDGVRTILDLKTPDSGESERNDWRNLDRLRPGDEIKFVIGSRRDYEWTRDIIRRLRLGERNAILLSPEWESDVREPLADWLLEDGLPARYQIQLHKFIWPGVERGV